MKGLQDVCGRKINPKKSKFMTYLVPTPNINMDDNQLETVKSSVSKITMRGTKGGQCVYKHRVKRFAKCDIVETVGYEGGSIMMCGEFVRTPVQIWASSR